MTGPDLSGIEPPSRVDIPTLRPSSDPQDESLVAPNIPHYRILRQLGIGGMGAVWEAEQQHTRRVVALKVIRPGWVSTPLLRRFEHEVELLGRLQHPGIAQIFEAGTADAGSGPQPFFAMELINGLRLDEWAARTKPALPKRLEMLTRICDAVQYAHQKGVIHRDLKPGNILVDQSGQPKILDFGVARAIDSDVKATSINTSTGQIIGTLQYMSPEQAGGEAHQVDTRSDVYALGMIAYELMADRLPYEVHGKPLPEAIRVIREEQRTRLSEIDRNFRGDLETIVGKALEHERDRRYSSASEMGADIRHFLNYEPISARPPGTWYQLSRFARRNNILVGGALAVLLALMVGMAATSVQWLRARRAEQIAQGRFNDLRTLANRFMFDVHSKIENLAGSTPASKMLVETSLTYLNKLAADAGNDPGLLRELSMAYTKVGDIQGNPNFHNTGDTAGALTSYRKAQEITLRLLDSDPTNPQLLHDQATMHLRIGDMLATMGDTGGALSNSRQALAISQRRATGAAATDAEALRDLFQAHFKIGLCLSLDGTFQEAMSSFRESQRIARGLAGATPGDADRVLDLVQSSSKVGDMLAATGDSAAALDEYRAVMPMLQQAAAGDPTNTRWPIQLALLHTASAWALESQDKYTDSLQHCRSALEIRQRLAKADPMNARAQREWMISLNRIGAVLTATRDFSGSLSHYEQAGLIARDRAKADPNDAEAQRDLGVSFYYLGDAHQRLASNATTPSLALSEWRLALEDYTSSLEMARDMQKRGILTGADAAIPEGLEALVAKSSGAIAKLQSASTDATTSPVNAESPQFTAPR